MPVRLDCPNEKQDHAPVTPLQEMESYRCDGTPQFWHQSLLRLSEAGLISVEMIGNADEIIDHLFFSVHQRIFSAL